MKFSKLSLVLILGMLIFACSKNYLEKAPVGLIDESGFANKKGLEGLLIGAYSLLDGIGNPKSSWLSAASNWIYGSVCGTEANKGSVDYDQSDINSVEAFTATASNNCFDSKWSTVYDGVQRANDVLRIMEKTDLSQGDRKRIEAEARFLRAHYHFEAKKMWNKIPFIDETVTYQKGNYHVSNQQDVWPKIEDDLLFAVANLSGDPYEMAKGRATKYTAMALLAKAYIFQEKFPEAKPFLDSIINSRKFHLVKYYQNFDPAERNNDESIFSAQTSVNDGAGGTSNNGNFGDVLNFPMGGPGKCCGFFQPSQYLVNHFKTDDNGLPDLDTFYKTDVKSDQGIPSSDAFTPYSGNLDPRLDWTVGRRGIPYLDWGDHPGSAWLRDPAYGGPYSPKKNVYYKYQEGQLTDVSFWSQGTTTNNVNLIRYADVLLWAAEVESARGDLTKARDYVNQVRSRAADPSGWVKRTDGTYAANYNVGLYTNTWTPDYALKAIRYERMLELAMEGHRFFDLVRWKIADIEIAMYRETEKLAHLKNIDFKKGCNEYFPIPQVQVDLSAGTDGIKKLIQNPCY